MIAESYERIHRSNLVGMGIVPLQFLPGESADSLGLTGREEFTVKLPESEQLAPGMLVPVQVSSRDGCRRRLFSARLSHIVHITLRKDLSQQ